MKVIKGIFISIGVLLLLAITLIVIVGVSVLDNTNNANSEIENNPKSLSLLINDYAYDALESTEEDEKVSLLLSEYQINYILSAIKNEIKVPLVTIKSIYSIYNEDGSVEFEAPFSIFGFDSCLKGNIDLKLLDDGTIKFYLNELCAGKLSTDNAILKFILNNAINLNSITNSLEDLGIYVTLSRNDGEYIASMSKDQMNKTIANLLSVDSTDDLINAAIEAFIGDNSLFSLKFNDENKIGFILYLKDLAYNKTLEYDLQSGTNNITSIKDKVTTLFNNKAIDYDNLSITFDYLVRGYDVLTDENKAIIDTLDLSSISITNKKAYQGIVYRSNLTMAKIFLDASESGVTNILGIITKGYYDITISEDNLNEVFNSLDFIGTSFAFINEDGKVANVTISSLYANLENEKLTMYLVLDVNGKYINAQVNASVKENKDTILTLTIDSIYLGSKLMSENVTNYLLKYLSNVLVDTKFITINNEEKTMSLDFSSYIEGTFFETLSKSSINKFSITMSDKKLVFRISNSLIS